MTFQIDSQNIYCFATGKPFARIDDLDYAFSIDSIGSDLETALDELSTRALITMRPSPFWSSISPSAIEFARQNRPRELLSYLMNRMYAPIEHNPHKPMSFESNINARLFRCTLWSIIDSTDFAADQLEQLLFVLLELDTRFNLAKLSKPASVGQAWSESNIAKLLETLASWRDQLVEKSEKDTREAARSAEFWSGSKLTGRAFSKSFMETKPLTRPISKKAAAKKAEEDLFSSILKEMFPGETAIGLQPSVPSIDPKLKAAAMSAAVTSDYKPRNIIQLGKGPIKFGVAK